MVTSAANTEGPCWLGLLGPEQAAAANVVAAINAAHRHGWCLRRRRPDAARMGAARTDCLLAIEITSWLGRAASSTRPRPGRMCAPQAQIFGRRAAGHEGRRSRCWSRR
jgi:hypothetical protein